MSRKVAAPSRAAPGAVARSVAEGTRFEDALEELEAIVRALESGEQSLEESLERFERGVALSRFCRRSLGEAERKVQVLLEEDGAERLADFDADGGGSGGSGGARAASAARGGASDTETGTGVGTDTGGGLRGGAADASSATS